jgi:hypothetical protein
VHRGLRDNVFGVVYYGGPFGLIACGVRRARPRRCHAVQRRVLTEHATNPSTLFMQVPQMSRTPPPPDDDPLADFELPPELMSQTLEHAISDDASLAHERGHAVAAALQKLLPGSTVEYGFPGVVTAHLKSGAVARCGGPTVGWMIDLQRTPGAGTEVIEVPVDDDEADVQVSAAALAKKLKRR